jgi:hypothetical protein
MRGSGRQLWGQWKREGRGEAFEELVRPHVGFAYSVARGIGSGRASGLYVALDDADRVVRWNAGLGAVAPGPRT